MPDSRDIETIEWLAERLSYACTTKQGDCGIPEPCPLNIGGELPRC